MMGGKTFTYDSENHMTSMTSESTFITMKYDAFGNRVSKTVNGVTTQYLVEDDVNPTGYPQVVEELTGPIGAGVVTRTYTYGLQRISQNLSPTVTGNATWTPSFYGYDGFGTVRQLTDTAGAPTDTYEYDAYGNFFTKTGTTPNNYLYRGEQYDSDLGLYYLRARYYNTGTGRFVSMDPENGIPTDPKTLHKYVYGGGDPVNALDPTGHMALTDYALIGVAMFGTLATVYEYDIYTGRTKKMTAAQTILALKQLACATTSLLTGPVVALQQALSGHSSDKIDYDFVECTARGRITRDCKEEWADAYEYCATLGTSPQRHDKAKHKWGGNFTKSVLGQVSQRCGGNRVE